MPDLPPSAITTAHLEAAIAVADATRLFLRAEIARAQVPPGMGGAIVLLLLARILGEHLQPPRQADTLAWVSQGLRSSLQLFATSSSRR